MNDSSSPMNQRSCTLWSPAIPFHEYCLGKIWIISYITAVIACSVISTTANTLVLIAIQKTRWHSVPFGILLTGLCLSDLGIATIDQPAVVVFEMTKFYGVYPATCHSFTALETIQSVFSRVSFINLVVISVERGLTLYLGSRYSIITPNRTRITLVLIWTFVGFFAILRSFVADFSKFEGKTIIHAIIFVVMVSVLCASYTTILWKLQSAKRLLSRKPSSSPNSHETASSSLKQNFAGQSGKRTVLYSVEIAAHSDYSASEIQREVSSSRTRVSKKLDAIKDGVPEEDPCRTSSNLKSMSQSEKREEMGITGGVFLIAHDKNKRKKTRETEVSENTCHTDPKVTARKLGIKYNEQDNLLQESGGPLEQPPLKRMLQLRDHDELKYKKDCKKRKEDLVQLPEDEIEKPSRIKQRKDCYMQQSQNGMQEQKGVTQELGNQTEQPQDWMEETTSTKHQPENTKQNPDSSIDKPKMKRSVMFIQQLDENCQRPNVSMQQQVSNHQEESLRLRRKAKKEKLMQVLKQNPELREKLFQGLLRYGAVLNEQKKQENLSRYRGSNLRTSSACRYYRNQAVALERYKRTIVTIRYFLALFILCYVPCFLIASIAHRSSPSCEAALTVRIAWFIYALRAAINPLLCLWRYNDLRKASKTVFLEAKCQR